MLMLNNICMLLKQCGFVAEGFVEACLHARATVKRLMGLGAWLTLMRIFTLVDIYPGYQPTLLTGHMRKQR